METASRLMDLPISGTGCAWAEFLYKETGGTLRFGYTDRETGAWRIGSLHFTHVMCFRFRDEMHGLGFYDDSYESVAEVFDSEWLAQMERIEPDRIYKLWKRRHFAAFLTSCGFFELIAEDCTFTWEDG